MQRLDQTNVLEIKIVYSAKIKYSERPSIQSSSDIYSLLFSKQNLNNIELQEEFMVLYLNRANWVLGVYHVSAGGIYGTFADTRLILAAVLNMGASGIALSHNHPSGSLRPSLADGQLINYITESARYHSINFLDHLIITPESYFSFKAKGFYSRFIRVITPVSKSVFYWSSF